MNNQDLSLFEVDYVFDRGHLTKMFKYPCSKLLRAQKVLAYIYVPVGFIFGFTVLLLCLRFRFSSNYALYMGLSIICIMAAILELFTFPEIKTLMTFGKTTGGKASMRCHYIFDNEKMFLWDETGETSSFTYDLVTSFGEDAEAFSMMIKNKYVLRVPKYAFTKGDPSRFSALILSRMSKERKVSVSAVVNVIATSIMIFISVTILLLALLYMLMYAVKVI